MGSGEMTTNHAAVQWFHTSHFCFIFCSICVRNCSLTNTLP